MAAITSGIRIAIDRGGTFTDAWAWIPESDEKLVIKVLSQSPEYPDAPTECIRQILETAGGQPIPKGTLLNLDQVESVRMGTTVATNALLERKGERTALVITKGFRDILEIGNQARPHIFDLSVRRMGKLYEAVVEVDERVTIEGFAEEPEPKAAVDVNSDPCLTTGLSGEAVRILKTPDYDQVRRDFADLWSQGYRSVAIAVMHSYTFQDHELGIAKIAQELGFKVSASSELQKMAKIVLRSQSAVADAYLSPVTEKYLESFRKGFQGQLQDHNARKLFLNQSDGGLTTYTNFTGLRGVLSGPAGGVIGLSKTCYEDHEGVPVLGFDSKLYKFASTFRAQPLTCISGWYQYRRRAVCWISRTRLREHHCRSHYSDTATRHQHRRGRWWFYLELGEWVIQGGPRECWC